MSGPAVAILDIGSNSIKVLVAAPAAGGGVDPLFSRSLDARISAGISAATPRLGEAGMDRGLAAIQELLAAAAAYAPRQTLLVATSAVRDAANGPAFRARVRAATGCDIRILTGEEEARAIGRGLTSDPALAHLRDFYVFDLGGGSLECLAFRRRTLEQALSLPLGCVRLTEKFVADPAVPLPAPAGEAIRRHVQAALAGAGFRFDLPQAAAVATGGTVTTARTILGALTGQPLEQTPALITVVQLRALLATLGALPLAARREVAGLAAARADVFPTALATTLAIAEAGGFAAFHHSLRNLRYGLAAELLAAL